jgi:succinyl-CoA synthetase alpha subunit
VAILIDRARRVLVQGITGREGMTRARLMTAYGTQIVAGVTPGKGGQTVEGVPVFDTVGEAWEHVGPLDVSVLFIPAPLVKNAALEAIAAGVKLLVIVPDRVPVYDVLEIVEAADRAGAQFVGPNTLGVLSPGRGVLGMMGGSAARARAWFFPGPVGISSGDPVVGLPHPAVMRLFERDSQTRLVVLFGEIGTSQEEQVADLIAAGELTKPVIAYIGGKGAKSGTRFSHAGAIIEGGRGTHEGKVARLRGAGVTVVDTFADIPRVTRERLDEMGVGYV